MSTVLLATFHDLEPAQRLCNKLRQASVPAVLHDETWLQRWAFVSSPLASIHVEVPASHFPEAKRLTREWDMLHGILGHAVRCPECRSSRIEFPQITRKFVSPALMGVFMAMRILPRKFYCFDCHYTWPTVTWLYRKRDILGWPLDSRLWHPEINEKKDRG